MVNAVAKYGVECVLGLRLCPHMPYSWNTHNIDYLSENVILLKIMHSGCVVHDPVDVPLSHTHSIHPYFTC